MTHKKTDSLPEGQLWRGAEGPCRTTGEQVMRARLANHLTIEDVPSAKQPEHMIDLRHSDSRSINCHTVVSQFMSSHFIDLTTSKTVKSYNIR